LVAGIGQSLALPIVLNDQIAMDWHTGLAIYGFDPVAYFTDSKPRVGSPEFEYALAGATWRFRNEGNRAAFITHPEVYTPAFGGYDPIAVAKGVATAGHPQFWMIADQRLYLFRDEATRAEFAADPAKSVTDAEIRWPSVLRDLVP
jgi:hypothetical protein